MGYSTKHGDLVITNEWRFATANQALEAAGMMVPEDERVKVWADASYAPVTYGIRSNVVYPIHGE